MEQETLGKYTLVSKIADGGMAEVFLAQTNSHGGFAKRVAIKRILPYFTRDDAFVRSFINEARICGQLNHPNLVEVYEFAQEEDVHYLAMEFIDGLDLERLLDHLREKNQPLPVGIASSLVLQILDGLDYAHAAKGLDGIPLHLIHRDLKPSNILIDRSGVVKIVDFGIAKASSNLYKTRDMGTAKGTVGYMSPEQTVGASDLTPASDIFSIGIIFFELLTLKRLFEGKNVFAILEAVRTADVDEKLRHEKSLPKPIQQLLQKALNREPGARYKTAGLMTRALRACSPGDRGHAKIAQFLKKCHRDGLAPSFTLPSSKAREKSAAQTKRATLKTDPGSSVLTQQPAPPDSWGAEEKTLPLPALLKGSTSLSEQLGPGPVPAGGDPLKTHVPSPQNNAPQSFSEEPTAALPASQEQTMALPTPPPPKSPPKRPSKKPAPKKRLPLAPAPPPPPTLAAEKTAESKPAKKAPTQMTPSREIGTRRGILLFVVVILVVSGVLGVLFSNHKPIPKISLEMTSDPTGAAIFVDGRQRLEKTPGVIDIQIDGTRTLTITAKMHTFQDETRQDVTLNYEDGAIAFHFDLVPELESSSIDIETIPPGAAVFIDGNSTDKYTPKTIKNIPIGPHLLTLKKPGYQDLTIDVELTKEGLSIIRDLPR